MMRARVLFVAGALILGAVAGCGGKPAAKASTAPSPAGSSPVSASTPPPTSAAPASTGPTVVPSDYTVLGVSVCSWEKKAGVIRLSAAFSILYTGTAPAGDVSYTVTESHSNMSETGTVIASMLGSGSTSLVAGVSAPGFSDAVGEQVTLTVTIQAAGDTDTTDNTAIETMTVPAVAATAKDTALTVIDCDGP